MDESRQIATGSDPDIHAFAENHYQFDLVVAKEAQNNVLFEMFKSLRHREISAHTSILHLPGAMLNSLVQHQRILDALQSHDVRKARRAAKLHFESVARLRANIGPGDDL